MDKFLAIVALILVILIAAPHLRAGEWISPTAIAPHSWITSYDTTGMAQANATPPEGYGWFHFDFWNGHSPYENRPVQKGDFRIRL